MSTLYVDNLEPNLGSRVLAAGHVVQVVQGTYSTETLSTSTSYTDTGLQATITPTATSSKIMIFVSLSNSGVLNNAGADGRGHFGIDRSGSTLYESHCRAYDYGNSGVIMFAPFEMSYLDSPSTTSATTYKLQQRLNTGHSIRVCDNQLPIHMQLMEIAQ